MAGRTILITGVAGFIGAALARHLAAAGDRVVGTDLQSPPTSTHMSEFAAGDIRDAELLLGLCRRGRVDQIVHCGGISGRRVDRDNPRAILDININGTINVVEAARQTNVSRVVFLSSGSVYGRNTDDLVSENASLVPVNSYGATKVAGEAIVNAYTTQWGLDGVSLRVFQAYGPGRKTRCNIRTMVQSWRDGTAAKVENDAASRCQYVYIDDVVDAIAATLDRPRLPKPAYNISGDRSLTMAQIADIARQALPGLDVALPEPSGPSEYALKEIDLGAAASDLGYRPKIDLLSGIRLYGEAETATP
ncbi:MAG: NAD-dependent epimerase/dehydratase family protein [Hyphomicrobiales bacterium]